MGMTTPVNSTTIVLADDHHVVREGLRSLLEAEPDFSVVGETGDGLEAAQLVERLQPDVLVLDLVMPGLNGLEVTRRVSQRSPQTRVVILSNARQRGPCAGSAAGGGGGLRAEGVYGG